MVPTRSLNTAGCNKKYDLPPNQQKKIIKKRQNNSKHPPHINEIATKITAALALLLAAQHESQYVAYSQFGPKTAERRHRP